MSFWRHDLTKQHVKVSAALLPLSVVLLHPIHWACFPSTCLSNGRQHTQSPVLALPPNGGPAISVTAGIEVESRDTECCKEEPPGQVGEQGQH